MVRKMASKMAGQTIDMTDDQRGVRMVYWMAYCLVVLTVYWMVVQLDCQKVAQMVLMTFC